MTSLPPRPAAGTQNAGLVFALLLLAILGGDYYVLTHGPEIAQARLAQRITLLAQQKAQQEAKSPVPGTAPSTAAAESLTPKQRLAATMARIAEKKRQERIKKAQESAAPVVGEDVAKGAVAMTSATDQGLVKAKTGTDALANAGSRVGNKLLLMMAKLYTPYGVYLRALLLLAGLALVFIQKAPQQKPGQPKRRAISPQALRIAGGLSGLVFLIAGYVLLSMGGYSTGFIEYGYPGAAVAVLASCGLVGLLWATTKKPAFGLSTERRKVETEDGIYFQTADGGWITLANPFRGTLVLGGAGAGKTYSIGEPLIEQFAYKNFAGLVYDFKFPVLAEALQKALVLAERRKKAEREKKDKYAASAAGQLQAKVSAKLFEPEQQPEEEEKPVQLHFVNFRDLTRSEKVNPLRAADMPVVAFAEEYSRAIINNLNPASIRKMEFFDISAVAYLTGIIWFYKKHFPQYCTIPHVVATAMYRDYTHVLSMLETDIECGDQVRSIISAIQTKADKQVGAVLGTLQVTLTRINSPEIVWVLTPNEAIGEGFSLDLNNKKSPKLLCIGNDPTLKETFSPVVSCVITVALKLMNQQRKHRSYVFLDEAATIYVPGLEVIPATARSNKVAMVYMTQDLAQMTDAYGKEKMQVMVSNLNNQFFGKVNSLETAKFISEMVGREDKEMTSTSTGTSQGRGARNNSTNQSTSYQERNLVRVQDTIGLQQGEFIGQTVETGSTFFQGTISRADATRERFPLHPMVSFGGPGDDPDKALSTAVMDNFLLVRRQVQETLNKHINTLAGGTKNEG